MKNSLQLLLLLLSITIINYFDRSAISYAIFPIENELGLTNTEFGLIAGAFGIGYLVMTLFAGFFLDRFGSVAVWGTTAVIWSIVTMCMGLASGFWSLLSLRIALGMAEGFNSPAILRTVYDWLDPKWRARSISMALLGVPLASIIAGPFISFLIEKEGWRAMFYILGCLGIVWALFWFLHFYRQKQTILSEPYAGMAHVRDFFTSVPYLANCFNFFTFGCIVFFVLMWLPGYLQQTQNVDLRLTGFLTIIPWTASAILQSLGGWAVDYLNKKTGSFRISRVYPMCFGLFCASLSFFGLSMASSLPAVIALISLGLGFTFFVNPSIYSINGDLFPHNPATSQSISTCFFALAGVISPTLTGFFSDKTGDFLGAIYFIAILSLLASISSFFFQKTT